MKIRVRIRVSVRAKLRVRVRVGARVREYSVHQTINSVHQTINSVHYRINWVAFMMLALRTLKVTIFYFFHLCIFRHFLLYSVMITSWRRL